MQRMILISATLVLITTLTAQARDVNSDLLKAAENGQVEKVKALLAKGADVNAKDKNGYTALLLAAINGHDKVVEALLAGKADVNAKHENGETALTIAARMGHVLMVKTLLSGGADPNVKSKNIGAAMIIASQTMIDTSMIIADSMPWNGLPSQIFDFSKTTSGGLDPNLWGRVTRFSLGGGGGDVGVPKLWGGVTALMWAVMCERTDIVKDLLNAGADINAKDDKGNTALIAAAAVGYSHINISQAGKTMHIGLVSRRTPVREKIHVDIIQTLLANGADINAKDNEGITALMKTADSLGDKSLLVALLDKGADANAKDRNGRTALMIAAKRRDIELVGVPYTEEIDKIKALLDKGADVNASDNQGKTVIMYANGLSKIRLFGNRCKTPPYLVPSVSERLKAV